MLSASFHSLRTFPKRLRRHITQRAHAFQFDHTPYRGVLLRIHFLAPDTALGRLKQAVDLIADTDPISFARLARTLPGGIAAEATNQSAAWYVHASRTCYIGTDTIASGDISDIALCIVHEMCHARLYANGITHDQAQIARIEQVCARRERAFARKLVAHGHEPQAVVDWIQHRLDTFAPDSYAPAARFKTYRKQQLDRVRQLKQTSLPRWLRRALILRTRRNLIANRRATQNL
ncbi:MAG: hypothetical protein AAF227_03565 [Pseudomonadota bacterium]